MRYFPPELLNDANSLERPRLFRAASRRFERNLKLYKRQLATLENRVSMSAWRFISCVNTHDGTLLSIEAGDFISGHVPIGWLKLVNRRRSRVRVLFAPRETGVVYEITYSGIKAFSLEYAKVPEWRWSLRECFDDWLIDEWTAAGKSHLCHEVLFSSGAWFRMVFRQVRVQRRTSTARR